MQADSSLPIHLASMVGMMDVLRSKFPLESIAEGDLFVANDPHVAGGTHLPVDEFDTVGGLISDHLGRVPRRGEVVILDDLRFEVLRADARQVQLLLVERVPLPAGQGDTDVAD